MCSSSKRTEPMPKKLVEPRQIYQSFKLSQLKPFLPKLYIKHYLELVFLKLRLLGFFHCYFKVKQISVSSPATNCWFCFEKSGKTQVIKAVARVALTGQYN